MYELPLVVLAAINLGLILAVHVRLGALETDPVTNVGVGGRIESFEKSSQLAWKPHQVSPNRWRSTVPLSFCLQPPSQRVEFYDRSGATVMPSPAARPTGRHARWPP
jgi:hypothetical protein